MRVSEEFHEFVKSHKREDETMEEAIRRLIGGPHPEEVAGVLSSDTAEELRRRLRDKEDSEDRHLVRERFE